MIDGRYVPADTNPMPIPKTVDKTPTEHYNTFHAETDIDPMTVSGNLPPTTEYTMFLEQLQHVIDKVVDNATKSTLQKAHTILVAIDSIQSMHSLLADFAPVEDVEPGSYTDQYNKPARTDC